jgi:choline dehydrogenase-like flavoprotein
VNTFDIVIIGSGAGGGTIARELAGTGAKIRIVERGDFCPRKIRTEPGIGLEGLRYRTTETSSTKREIASSLHAPLRRRQHQVLGHGDAAAPEDFKEMQRRRRFLAWPIDYDTSWCHDRRGSDTR